MPGRIIPAYAGSTTRNFLYRPKSRDHPRIRGEHRRRRGAPCRTEGSSPHTRGARTEQVAHEPAGGIIPAYAGSTYRRLAGLVARRDHPRIRGEHFRRSLLWRASPGSSPHTRGALPRPARPTAHDGIIPAYAGSTRCGGGSGRGVADHPRIRGEHPNSTAIPGSETGSSPHTRGAHLEIPAIPRIAAVIIPVFLYPSPTPQEEADRSMVLLTLS